MILNFSLQAMKPKPPTSKLTSVSSSYIPSVSVPSVVQRAFVQVAPMVKEKPRKVERPLQPPESIDIGEVSLMKSCSFCVSLVHVYM